MAWDFIGSEFGSRHQQYEKFYGGASFLVKQNVYRGFDFKRATGAGRRRAGLAAGRSGMILTFSIPTATIAFHEGDLTCR